MNPGTIPMSPGVWISPVAPMPLFDAQSFSLHFRHGLGTRHLRATWLAVCQRANNGYLPGDEIALCSQCPWLGVDTYLTFWHNNQETGVAGLAPAGEPYIFNASGREISTGFALGTPNWGIRVIVEALAP